MIFIFFIIDGKEIAYQNGGFFKKGFSVKEECYLGGNYKIITLKSRRINWKKLRNILGASSGKVVLCEGIGLPEDCGISPIDTSEISYVFLKNAVEYLLENSSIPIQKRMATIIDLRGVYHDLARIMAKHCALLKVVTLHHESYDHLSEQLREEMGAVLQVTDVLDRPNENLMIVSPKGFGADFAGAVTSPVVTLEPEQFCGAQALSGFYGVDLSPFKLVVPKRVNQLQLVAALYSVEAHRELKNFLPLRCLWNNCETTLQNILEQRFLLDTEEQI